MGKNVIPMINTRLFLVLSSFLIANFSLAQTTIYTPKGSVVADTYTLSEASPSQIAWYNNYAATNYPNATKLADASETYNCHGYAWHIIEGGSTVWIGTSFETAENIYWSDGSYVEVCSQQFPSKVGYGDYANHSAITTNTTDIFKSKWGSLPLMQHDKSYSPYNTDSLKYYIRAPEVVGLDYNVPTNTSLIPYLNPAFPGATSYSWELVYPSSGASVFGTTANGNVTFWNPGEYTILVTANYSCGSLYVLAFYSASDESEYFRASPNPVNDELTVSYSNDKGSIKKVQSFKKLKTFKFTLYNINGIPLRSGKNREGENNSYIDTRDIPNGTYYLHIEADKRVVKKQIIVNH